MNWTVYAVGSMLIGKPVARATSNICTVEESIFHFKTIIIEDGLSPSFRETVDLYDELLSDSDDEGGNVLTYTGRIFATNPLENRQNIRRFSPSYDWCQFYGAMSLPSPFHCRTCR